MLLALIQLILLVELKQVPLQALARLRTVHVVTRHVIVLIVVVELILTVRTVVRRLGMHRPPVPFSTMYFGLHAGDSRIIPLLLGLLVRHIIVLPITYRFYAAGLHLSFIQKVDPIAIIGKHHIALTIGQSLVTLSVHSVLAPLAFILASVRQEQDAAAVSLSVSVLAHVFNEVWIQGDAHASHLVILVHALVAEAVFEETCADAVLLVLAIHLPVKHFVVLFYPDEVFVDVHVRVSLQFLVVLRY